MPVEELARAHLHHPAGEALDLFFAFHLCFVQEGDRGQQQGLDLPDIGEILLCHPEALSVLTGWPARRSVRSPEGEKMTSRTSRYSPPQAASLAVFLEGEGLTVHVVRSLRLTGGLTLGDFSREVGRGLRRRESCDGQ